MTLDIDGYPDEKDVKRLRKIKMSENMLDLIQDEVKIGDFTQTKLTEVL